MSVYRRGKIWWYTFEFQGRRVQESSGFTNKPLLSELRQSADRNYSIEKQDSLRPKWRRSPMSLSIDFSPGRKNSTGRKRESFTELIATHSSDPFAVVGSMKSHREWSRILSSR
jgi:hypothetical protein